MKVNLMIIEMRMQKKKKNINKKSSQLPNHQLIKQLKLDELLWVFDATSLYPSAMCDENSGYPKLETGYAYTEDMKQELVEKFINQNFIQ